MSINIPDWLPDWKDESQYPIPIQTTENQWAWQFLRRNTEYQLDYKKFVKKNDGQPVIFSNSASDPKYPNIELTTTMLIMDHTGRNSTIFTARSGHLMLYPCNKKGQVMSGSFPAASFLDPGEVLLKIDTKIPIEPQISKYKDYLESKYSPPEHQKITKNTPNVMRLRVIDARTINVTIEKIAKELSLSVRQVNIYQKDARRLIKGEYSFAIKYKEK